MRNANTKDAVTTLYSKTGAKRRRGDIQGCQTDPQEPREVITFAQDSKGRLCAFGAVSAELGRTDGGINCIVATNSQLEC